MSTRTRTIRPWLAPAIAVALCMWTPTALGMAPKSEHEGLLAAAEELERAGHREDALEAYMKALKAMPPELRTSGVGEFVALEAGRVALEDYDARADVRSLELGRSIIRDYIASVQASGAEGSSVSLDAVRQRLAELKAQMPEPAPELEPAPEPEPEPEPAPGDITFDDAATPPPERWSGIGQTGIALLVVGGLTAGAGVALLFVPPTHFPRNDPRAHQITTTRPPGWALLGSGLATATVGGILLGVDRKRRRDRTAAITVGPWWTRGGGGGGGGGLRALGRF